MPANIAVWIKLFLVTMLIIFLSMFFTDIGDDIPYPQPATLIMKSDQYLVASQLPPSCSEMSMDNNESYII